MLTGNDDSTSRCRSCICERTGSVGWLKTARSSPVVKTPKKHNVLATDALAASVSRPESRPRMRGAAANVHAQLKILSSCITKALIRGSYSDFHG